MYLFLMIFLKYLRILQRPGRVAAAGTIHALSIPREIEKKAVFIYSSRFRN